MKISRKAYFLILIIEECAEIIHRTCKALRFGMEERWKPEDKTNQELLEDELIDLQVIVDLNRSVDNLREGTVAEVLSKMERKKERVEHFLTYSISGCQTVLNMRDGVTPNKSLCYQNWKAEQEKPKCRHNNDADTCDVCEDIRSGNVNTEG